MIEAPDILERLRNLVLSGSGILGMFDRTILSRSRALELIDMLIESLPEEMDQARDIEARREEIFEKSKQQAGEIIDAAVKKSEKLIDADIITVGAKKRAGEIMDKTDIYIAERLKGLEEELKHLLVEVRNGIQSLTVEGTDSAGRKR